MAARRFLLSKVGIRSMGTAAKLTKLGCPRNVFTVESEIIEALKPNEVHVKMLFAPITPGDLQATRGSYMPSLHPIVGGSQGVGVVTNVGSEVKDLKAGDKVIPSVSGLGTWRTELKADASKLLRVPSTLSPEFLSAIVSPLTAYRLLNDFVNLKPGDVIVQNGCNGSVGLSVIQLAKARGIKTVNIMRNRPGFEMLAESIQNLGAEIVVPDDYARTTMFQRLISDLGEVKLGLNAVGGKHASSVLGGLSHGATLVTYGAMAPKPTLYLPSSAFLYHDLTLRGFNLERWVAGATQAQKDTMFADVAAAASKKDLPLHLWLEVRPFSEFSETLKRATSEFVDRKVILDFSR